jgi:hypothetical protein
MPALQTPDGLRRRTAPNPCLHPVPPTPPHRFGHAATDPRYAPARDGVVAVLKAALGGYGVLKTTALRTVAGPHHKAD